MNKYQATLDFIVRMAQVAASVITPVVIVTLAIVALLLLGYLGRGDVIQLVRALRCG